MGNMGTLIVIKNGIVVDPASGFPEEKQDLLIEDNRIAAREPCGSFQTLEGAERVIDASDCWVVPGLIDIHVHLREPGFEWKETIETGAWSAVAGGFTRVCCMPNTNPVNDSAEITKFIIEQGTRAHAARVHPIGAVSRHIAGEAMAPLSELKDAGCVAFADDGHPVWDALLMRRALEWCRHLDIPLACHEEERSLTRAGAMNESPLSYRLGIGGMPSIAEDIMVARDIELARHTGAKVHICHITSSRSVELVRRAKHDAVSITAEVSPHHLMLTEDAVSTYDTNMKMSPPLRTEEDRHALIEGLRDGTIDVIASDHAPHERDSKLVEFAEASFGIIGFPTTLSLALELVKAGKLSRTRAIEALTTLPAQIFGLEGGTLAVGSVADVTVIDPVIAWTLTEKEIVSKSKNTPFIDRALRGKAKYVLVGGNVLLDDFKLCRGVR